MSRVIHTGQALVDVVVEVPDLPVRGQNVMASTATDYAGGAVTVLVAAARFGAECVHAGAHGTGPHGDLIRTALGAEGIDVSAPPVPDLDTGICVVMVEPSAERTFVTTLGAERRISVESLATSDPRPGDLVCVTGFSLALDSTRDPLLAWLPTLDPDVVVVLDPGRRSRASARTYASRCSRSPTCGRATPRRPRTCSARWARRRRRTWRR